MVFFKKVQMIKARVPIRFVLFFFPFICDVFFFFFFFFFLMFFF